MSKRTSEGLAACSSPALPIFCASTHLFSLRQVEVSVRHHEMYSSERCLSSARVVVGSFAQPRSTRRNPVTLRNGDWRFMFCPGTTSVVFPLFRSITMKVRVNLPLRFRAISMISTGGGWHCHRRMLFSHLQISALDPVVVGLMSLPVAMMCIASIVPGKTWK